MNIIDSVDMSLIWETVKFVWETVKDREAG